MKNINYSSRAQDSNLHSPNSKSGWLPITTALVKKIQKYKTTTVSKETFVIAVGVEPTNPNGNSFTDCLL